jgi:hypothetical protein
MNIDTLPDELIIKIYLRCDLDSIKRLRQTNKKLYSIGIDPTVDNDIRLRFDEAIYLFIKHITQPNCLCNIQVEDAGQMTWIQINKLFDMEDPYKFRIKNNNTAVLSVEPINISMADYIDFFIWTRLELDLPFKVTLTYDYGSVSDEIKKFMHDIFDADCKEDFYLVKQTIVYKFNTVNVERILLNLIKYYDI